jgi:hypothetical protein
VTEPAAQDALVVQAYGGERHRQRARFTVLTFQHYALRAAAPPRVLAYSDQPALFAGLGDNVQVVAVDDERLRAWRGAIDFVHRVKLEVLLDAFGRGVTRLLYVDGDTYFRVDPATLFARIRPGYPLMRVSEGPFSNRRSGVQRKMHDFVRRQPFRLPDGETVRLSEHTEMWDAGVIGLHAADAPLLRRALALTDAMYPLFNKHVIEQVAVSHVLQTRTVLAPVGDDVFHYWKHAHEIDPRLARFFAEHADLALPALAGAAYALQPTGTGRRRRWWQRLLRVGR